MIPPQTRSAHLGPRPNEEPLQVQSLEDGEWSLGFCLSRPLSLFVDSRLDDSELSFDIIVWYSLVLVGQDSSRQVDLAFLDSPPCQTLAYSKDRI